jgi:tetratricopeptide (TPR) repeat protein
MKSKLPTSDTYYQQGKLHQHQQQWAEAINAYKKAIDIDPQSEAATALEYIYQILNFSHSELLNP